jgi:hypothetical protein
MAPNASSGGIGGWLKFFAVLIGVLAPVVYVLEQNLQSFYIFETDHLHDLAKRGIQAHGNDTRSVVKYIVDELSERPGTLAHINRDEEWIFNNAGGAMGAMYIIHASKSGSLWFRRLRYSLCLVTFSLFFFLNSGDIYMERGKKKYKLTCCTGVTEYLIIFGLSPPPFFLVPFSHSRCHTHYHAHYHSHHHYHSYFHSHSQSRLHGHCHCHFHFCHYFNSHSPSLCL